MNVPLTVNKLTVKTRQFTSAVGLHYNSLNPGLNCATEKVIQDAPIKAIGYSQEARL